MSIFPVILHPALVQNIRADTPKTGEVLPPRLTQVVTQILPRRRPNPQQTKAPPFRSPSLLQLGWSSKHGVAAGRGGVVRPRAAAAQLGRHGEVMAPCVQEGEEGLKRRGRQRHTTRFYSYTVSVFRHQNLLHSYSFGFRTYRRTWFPA